jgi:CRISPR system Cascade subunit CasB
MSQAADDNLGYHMGRVAGIICSDQFPTGERAAFRRMNPEQSPPLLFYRFALTHLPADWEYNTVDWMVLLTGISIMAPDAHRPDLGVGKALATADYSEARLERLLASEGDTQRTLVLRSARLLAAKRTACNWGDYGQLLLTRDKEKREKLNRRIAKDFYQNIKKAEMR